MQNVLLIVHLMIVAALVVVVLLQRSDGGALGIGGGGGFMSGRGQANALTRATAILGAAFFTTSILLTILATMNKPQSFIQGGPAVPTSQSAPAQPGGAPAAPAPGNLLDTLRQREGGPPRPAAPAPAAPAAPAQQ